MKQLNISTWYFNSGSDWGPNTGGRGSIVPAGSSVTLSYDLSAGGVYVAAAARLAAPIALAKLRVCGWVGNDVALFVRLLDTSGQTIQYWLGAETLLFDGRRAYIDSFLDPATAWPESHWGGANTGKVSGSVAEIQILVRVPPWMPRPAPGTFDLSLGVADADDDVVTLGSPATQLPDSPDLGVCAHWCPAPPLLKTLQDNGVKSMRVDVEWWRCETVAGKYDFSSVAPFMSCGMPVLPLLNSGNVLYDITTDVGQRAFGNFCRAFLRQYPNIRRVEIWNEPDNLSFAPAATNQPAKRDPVLFSKIVETARQACGPSVEVITGGISFIDPSYIYPAVSAGVTKHATAFGIHPYRPPAAIESMSFELRQLAGGVGGPFEVTELGHPYQTAASEAAAAHMLIKSHIMLQAAGAARWHWYDVVNDGNDPNNGEHNFGLFRTDLTPKPGWAAWCYHFRRTFNMRAFVHRAAPCVFVVSYWLAGGGTSPVFYAMWVKDRPVRMNVPATWAQVENWETWLPAADGGFTLTPDMGVVYVTPMAGFGK